MSKRKDPLFHYNDKVKVRAGFYEDMVGQVKICYDDDDFIFWKYYGYRVWFPKIKEYHYFRENNLEKVS